MIRNLKILIAAAMALAAFGAISAASAQAAEGHCGVEPCTITVKPDGTPGPTGKTAHHVFIVKQKHAGKDISVATTCQTVTGDATPKEGKTFKTIELTSIAYHECNVAGEKSTVKMNGCNYHFAVGGVHSATAQVICPAGKSIEIEVPANGCRIEITSTGVLAGGLTFKDPETGGVKKTEITAEVTVTNIPATIANEECPGELTAGAATGEYTTGNVELTAEEDGTEKHTNLWWE